MTNSFLFLGSGSSMGVPLIGCHCAVCRSPNPYNKRTRSSGLLTVEGKRFLIDCGPDFRQQALQYHIEYLDGVILTHAHQDHTAGIDDLRAYYIKNHQPVPCLLSEATARDLRARFNYIFAPAKENTLTPKLTQEILPAERGEVIFRGVKIQYMTYDQVGMPVNGFRVGPFAYISDIYKYPSSIFDDLAGVEILVLSALRKKPSHMHFSVDDAVAFARKVGASQTWLTHIAHEIEHQEINNELPPEIRLSFDGLEITF